MGEFVYLTTIKKLLIVGVCIVSVLFIFTPVVFGSSSVLSNPKTKDEVKGLILLEASKYDIDIDLAVKIIGCESGFQLYATNTQSVVGADYGLFQINSYWHGAAMKKMNLDILDWRDSLTYGFKLLESRGTKDWKWSKHCWSV